MATKDGRVQIWYAGENGNVTGYTESVGDIVDTIISVYNEHFGTDIGLWTPETKTLQVGGTVPNWDAYEKIELPSNKIAVKIPGGGQTGLIVGTLNDDEFNILTDGSGSLIADVNGNVQNYSGPPASATTAIIQFLAAYDIVATSITESVVSYAVGSEIPSWDEYQKYI